jgi:hypothetical protein
MRLSADQIKQALLNPEWEVRDMALGYFQESFSTDRSIMPVLIEAVGRYGWNEACSPFAHYRPLEQTEATVRWLIEQLQLPCPDLERERLWMCWTRFLSWQLNGAAVELLVPQQRILETVENLDPECRENIQKRVDVAFMDPETGWRELESYCEQSAGECEPIDYADEDFHRYVEVILRDGARFSERVLALLAESNDDLYDDDPSYWMHVAATELAGRLRLAAAVPSLVERLEVDVDNDGQWYCYRCADALIRIGSDEVIRAVGDMFLQASWDFRAVTSKFFEGIHSEFTVQRGLELMAAEADDTLCTYLADGLLFQFDSAVIEPVRNQILRGNCNEQEEVLIRRLVAVTTLMNLPVPEQSPWRERAHESLAKYRQSLEDRLNEDGRLPDAWDNEIEELERIYGPFDDLDEELDDEFEDLDEFDDAEDFDDGLDELDDDSDEEVLRPIVHSTPKVGRNDPCPCGSGKKFKKCCMHRQKDPPKIDW